MTLDDLDVGVIVLAVPSYAAALLVVGRTDLVGLVPRVMGRAVVDAFGLVALEAPMELPPIEIRMARHQRYDADGAHAWLRQCVRDTLTAL